MMKMDMNKLINIKLMLLIIIFASCSTTNKNNKSLNRDVIVLINDYIFDYSNIKKNEELYSILLRSDNDSFEIIIKDVPKTPALGYLKDSRINATMISGVLCLFYKDEIDFNKKIHMNISPELLQEANEKTKIMIGGEEYFVSNELTEWHPTLETIYNLERKEKTVKNLFDDTIRIIKFDKH